MCGARSRVQRQKQRKDAAVLWAAGRGQHAPAGRRCPCTRQIPAAGAAPSPAWPSETPRASISEGGCGRRRVRRRRRLVGGGCRQKPAEACIVAAQHHHDHLEAAQASESSRGRVSENPGRQGWGPAAGAFCGAQRVQQRRQLGSLSAGTPSMVPAWRPPGWRGARRSPPAFPAPVQCCRGIRIAWSDRRQPGEGVRHGRMAHKLWIGNLPPGACTATSVHQCKPDAAGAPCGTGNAAAALRFGSLAAHHASQALQLVGWRAWAAKSVRRHAGAAADGTAALAFGAARRRRPACSFLLPTAGIPDRDVEDAFSKYGRLRNCWVARKPPGFGFGER